MSQIREVPNAGPRKVAVKSLETYPVVVERDVDETKVPIPNNWRTAIDELEPNTDR